MMGKYVLSGPSPCTNTVWDCTVGPIYSPHTLYSRSYIQSHTLYSRSYIQSHTVGPIYSPAHCTVCGTVYRTYCVGLYIGPTVQCVGLYIRPTVQCVGTVYRTYCTVCGTVYRTYCTVCGDCI